MLSLLLQYETSDIFPDLMILYVVTAIPLSLICYRKRFLEGVIIWNVIFVIGLFQWVVQYFSWYGWISLRLIYPTLMRLLPINPLLSLWIINAIFWWIGCSLFYSFLRDVIKYYYKETLTEPDSEKTPDLISLRINRYEALFGVIIPLISLGTVFSGFSHVDGLNWIIIVSVFYCIYQYLNVKKPLWLFPLPFLGVLAYLNEYPLPVIVRSLVPYDVLFAITVFLWQIPFIVLGLQKKPRPWVLKRSLYFIPFYILVSVIATDWWRWVVFAAPITVPIILLGMRRAIGTD